MKIHGKKLDAPKELAIAFPRVGGDIVFKAKAVLDYSEFEKVCKEPEAVGKLMPGGKTLVDVKNPVYERALDLYAEQRVAWMIMESLSATPGLEWETVDMANPETWNNYATELSEAGLSSLEAQQLMELVTSACGLSQSRIDEATARFLAGEAATQEHESSLSTEQETTQSGEPAKDTA